MRVAIVHDDLVQWGGAERVLEGLCEIYPDAPIYTSVFDKSNKELNKRFGKKKIITSFLQKIPWWRSLYKPLFFLYPIAFEQFNFDEYDLVISNTTRFAKCIITKPKTVHICYCHTPPRFLWHFSDSENFGIGEIFMNTLKNFDQIWAKRVDFFIAGSENAKTRIKKVYNENSKVLYPFVDLKRFENVETFDGEYFVLAGRPSKYKRFDLAVETCRQIGVDLRIIDGNLSEEMVVLVLSGCKALIIPGVEDFGIVSLEAQALGKPVIAFKEGGSLETIIDSKTGVFFEKQSIESLKEAMHKLNSIKIDLQNCKNNAKRFSKNNFISDFRQIVASLLYTK
ncbi:hypothetical protein A3C59_04775 [Candidatus Daviesbacteria bacterium RIFCSPHIGHO2_02_FULL_36_13]|uniref:GDP-Man:Man(1)GlcNAc(2)-PP-Dol alpha-1,3-mannosyltransferase n=1 Tax=Candidatus Daviesbacteria bacterium RIFCSPHIGHO2_02_FULL_36_13 TaxID=1797768 RepID=A0A1F5JNM4_9BACT|nr:MAG: hypothetical protein A3C59_04775 [Candidatus Daviesbacteria bacterium RIFCSPHIGHO2_02_FULL_36_13]